MPEEVTMDAESILDFIERLGEHITMQTCNLDPEQLLGVEEEVQFQAISSMAAMAILRGFILANNQPGLAAAVVEQMDRQKSGYSDELLNEILSCYRIFLDM